MGKFCWLVGYSYIKVIYQFNFLIVNEVNFSVVDIDSDGVEDMVFVCKGDYFFGILCYQFKLCGEWQVLLQWIIGINLVVFFNQYFYGNENNEY